MSKIDRVTLRRVAILVALLAVVITGTMLADRAEGAAYPNRTVDELIADASARYHLNYWRMRRIADCESRFDPLAYNPAGPYYGLYQFSRGTWHHTLNRMGVPLEWRHLWSWYRADQNVEAAAFLMATEGYGHWGCR